MSPGLLMGADTATTGGGGVSGTRDMNIPANSDIGNFNLSSAAYRAVQRFVFDHDETISRWWFTYITDGSTPNPAPGHQGYGAGNEGTLHVQIREVDQGTGLPTATVVAEETGIAVSTRRSQLRTAFTSLPVNHQLMYGAWSAVTLDADTMYALVVRNTHASPGTGGNGFDGGNHGSTDNAMPTLAQAGPHGFNNLDPDYPGAMYGLDPRECTIWSGDSGSTWKFGDQVGWYGIGNGLARIWHGHGYRRSPSNEDVGHGLPGAVWPNTSNTGAQVCTITWSNCPVATTLTEAGGVAKSGSLGVVTVTNLTTGVSRTTASLGSGTVRGNLSSGGLPVGIGDSYRISAGANVETADTFSWREVYGIGTRLPYRYQSTGALHIRDLPALFAGPHPHYA